MNIFCLRDKWFISFCLMALDCINRGRGEIVEIGNINIFIIFFPLQYNFHMLNFFLILIVFKTCGQKTKKLPCIFFSFLLIFFVTECFWLKANLFKTNIMETIYWFIKVRIICKFKIVFVFNCVSLFYYRYVWDSILYTNLEP